MALALRYAEESEFSSRACDITSLEAPDVTHKAYFRWSRPVRRLLNPLAHDLVNVKTLIVAMPGAPHQFVKQLTASWTAVGALVTSDQMTCSPLAGIILSEKGLDVSIAENCLTLLVGQEVSSAATSVWLNKLRTHINAEDIVCLSSQVLTIYGDESTEAEAGAKLRMLATSAVTGEMTKQALVPSLEVPQFVAGIPAALLTHGELRQRRVRVFVSLRDVTTTVDDVMRSFLPLAATASSVLGRLERPLVYESTRKNNSAIGVLYT
uniref:Proteasome assembly chaperone 1 n=1 Tax=Hyaloperonospora arabidopsidis (strain Emoy2) TaxID=559515 RepID=M4BSA3_HYAAE